MEHIGKVTEHSIEERKKGNYHKITVEPEKWGYNVFDPKWFDFCKKDKYVKVVYEMNGKYRDVKSIEEVSEVAPLQSNEMSKADWERKDRAIHRCGIAKSFIESLGDWTPGIEANADRAFAWVMELPTSIPAREVAATPEHTEDIPAAIKVVRSRGDKLTEIGNIIMALGYTPLECKGLLYEKFNVDSSKELKDGQLDEVLTWAKQIGPKEKGLK